MYIPWRHFKKLYNGLFWNMIGNGICFIFIFLVITLTHDFEVLGFSIYGIAILLPTFYDSTCKYFKRKSWLYQQSGAYHDAAFDYLRFVYRIYGILFVLYGLLGFLADSYPIAIMMNIASYFCLMPFVIWLSLKLGNKGRWWMLPIMIFAYINFFNFMYNADTFVKVEAILPIFIVTVLLAVYFTYKIFKHQE